MTFWDAAKVLEAILLSGPRQIGKTSLLLKLDPPLQSTVFLDDPNEQARARNDPEFLLSQLTFPILIDEIQRAPELLLSIKKRIDEQRRKRMMGRKIDEASPVMAASFSMTVSNQSEIDHSLKETLAGRISIFRIHGLSAHEIWQHDPLITLNQILFRGGFPELWVRRELSPVPFINDYIATFIEKDIARTAGVEKISKFNDVLRLLAARTGELLNVESLARDAGISGKAVRDWLSLLERNGLIAILRPYYSNLNKRLIKMPKAYFIDSALCVRLQAHQEAGTILNTAQAGHLFENLVVAEAIKTRDHFRETWELHFWRTKEKDEIDLLIESDKTLLLIEIKLGSARGGELNVPPAIEASGKEIRRAFVTASGSRTRYTEQIDIIPLKNFCDYLREVFPSPI